MKEKGDHTPGFFTNLKITEKVINDESYFKTALKRILDRAEAVKIKHQPFVDADGIMKPGWIRDAQAKLAVFNNYENDISLLCNLLQEALDALEFYKNKKNWITDKNGELNSSPYFTVDLVSDDGGRIANKTIKSINAKLEGMK